MTISELMREIEDHNSDTDISYNDRGDIATIYADAGGVEILIDGECHQFGSWSQARKEPLFDGKTLDDIAPVVTVYP